MEYHNKREKVYCFFVLMCFLMSLVKRHHVFKKDDRLLKKYDGLLIHIQLNSKLC